MEKISKKLEKAMRSLFSTKPMKFSRIVVHKSVVDNIREFARANHPNEFVALLQGKVKSGKLVVEGLIYQPFSGSKSSSWMRINVPSLSGLIGSVHSHPSSSTKPSNTDLQFFNKNGIIHLITAYPYKEGNLACYDLFGNKQKFEVDKSS